MKRRTIQGGRCELKVIEVDCDDGKIIESTNKQERKKKKNKYKEKKQTEGIRSKD